MKDNWFMRDEYVYYFCSFILYFGCSLRVFEQGLDFLAFLNYNCCVFAPFLISFIIAYSWFQIFRDCNVRQMQTKKAQNTF